MVFGQILLIILLLVLTFWRRDIFLYILCFPVLVVFGLRWYDLYHNAAGFTMALVLVALGIYCIYLAIVNILNR